MTPTGMAKPAEPFLTHRETILGIYVLYLIGLVSGPIAPLVGLVFAYDERKGAGALATSHFTFQIRTFWKATALCLGGLAVCVGGLFLGGLDDASPDASATLLLAGTAIALAGHIFLLVKTITGMVRLNQERPADGSPLIKTPEIRP